MLKLLDLSKFNENVIKPVTTFEYFVSKSYNFHPDGLFSEEIFGSRESREREQKYSFISLNCQILHPALMSTIRRLSKKLLDAMSAEKAFKLDNEGNLIEDEEGEIHSIESVYKNFDKINIQTDTPQRKDLNDMVRYYYKNDLLFITKMVVIPPAFRDVEIFEDGSIRADELNSYYVEIIKLADKLAGIQSGVSYDVLSYKMYKAVLQAYQFMQANLSKKEGLIRSSILGKRVDFSARAAISGSGSELRSDQLGVPYKLLVKLFEPFIIYQLLNSGNFPKEQLASLLKKTRDVKLNASSLRNLFSDISKGDKIDSKLSEMIGNAIDVAIEDKVVITKRDPALHAESVQAFYPVRVDGNVIKINPVKCSGFNADFDGDQMAVYVPITKESVQEVKKKMVTNKSKDGIGQISDEYEKDTAIGIYSMTEDSGEGEYKKIKSEDELEKMDPTKRILWNGKKTTVGRVKFNKLLPDDYPFINEAINKKKLNKIAKDIYNKYDSETYKQFSKRVLEEGYKYNTLMAQTFGLDDFEIPQELYDLKEQLKNASPQEAQKILDEMEKKLKAHLEKQGGSLGTLGQAGGLKGGYGQIKQVLVAKGLITDNQGNLLDPISDSYTDGLDSKTFFEMGAGSRSGVADRSLNTADTGYISRQLIFALQRVRVDPNMKDCGTNKYFKIKATEDVADRLEGRYVVNEKGKLEKFDKEKYLGSTIQLRSPVYCQSTKLCRTCYGDLVDWVDTENVGILAGQVIGERGTQLIMQTFHTGGSTSVKTIDIIDKASQFLDDREQEFLQDNFYQEDDILYSKTSGNIVVDLELFKKPDQEIRNENNILYLNYGYINIESQGFSLEMTIDAKSQIDLKDKKIENVGSIKKIPFQEGQAILQVPPYADVFQNKVQVVSQTLSGKQPWRNSDHFATKIFQLYQEESDADLVHFEVAASNLLRDRSNPSYPARLNKDYQPIVMPIKKIPALENWTSALNFEDPNAAIETGLTYDRDREPSVLDRMIQGDL